MKKLSLVLVPVIVLSALAVNAAAASAAKVRNGGFEHNLKGWTQNSDAGGVWRSTLAGDEPGVSSLAPPKRGDRQAIASQDGPGARILTQTVRLRRKQRHKLSMWVQYENFAEDFTTPNTFDTELSGPLAASDRALLRGGSPEIVNQQIRIEVLRAKAPVRTTNRRKILATVMRTRAGDPLEMGWTRYRVNLSKFAGRKVKLRLAEVDTENFLFVGVDNVKIKSKRKRR